MNSSVASETLLVSREAYVRISLERSPPIEGSAGGRRSRSLRSVSPTMRGMGLRSSIRGCPSNTAKHLLGTHGMELFDSRRSSHKSVKHPASWRHDAEVRTRAYEYM